MMCMNMDPNTAHLLRFPENRVMPSDCISDSDLSKQSLSPKIVFRHDDSSEMSFGKVALSSSKEKDQRRIRSSSAPRVLLGDGNVCGSRDYNLPNFNISDYRKASAVYIEQDIINKQRQEIQLLMEELGNRDQELNDLVMSHQKQVKAWESDNEKFLALQARLNKYEGELKSREQQLKETLAEMDRVNEQREVDALELKQTQNEMIKLAERIMENSLYIKEMEAQNQKLSLSLKDFVNARKSFTVREQEILSVIEEKNLHLADKKKELDKMSEHIKYLECHCEELGERNNNTAVESINWRKKYYQMKEEADRLNVDCKSKEENVQKLTQQLHESLQQAIALQKALFTSCEREKCKEEVMYSLRKQHKRTMQELQSIRELYDRLSCDTTLYHLSVKDKDATKDGKKKEEDATENKAKRGKGDGNPNLEEEEGKRRHETRQKHETNTSSKKLKTPELNEQSFLVKETKERKQTKEEVSAEKKTGKTYEKAVCKTGERNAGSSEDRNKGYKAKPPDDAGAYTPEFENASPTASQKRVQKNVQKPVKNEQQSSAHAKPGHTPMYRHMATITSSTSLFSDEPNVQRSRSRKVTSNKKIVEPSVTPKRSTRLGNTSKNADYQDARDISNSRCSITKSMQSQSTSPFMICEKYSFHNKSIADTDKVGTCDSSSDVSHIVSPSQFDGALTPADSDGMCHELKRGLDREQLDRLSPMLETSCLESKRSLTPSNSMTLPKKSSFFRKDKTPYNADDVSTSDVKHTFRRKSVEFDASEDISKSVSVETHSQYLEPESEPYSPPAAERRHNSSTGRSAVYSSAQVQTSSNCKSVSPDGKQNKTSLNDAKSPGGKKHVSNNIYKQGSVRYLHSENDSEQEQDDSREDCHNNGFGSAHKPLKYQNLGDGSAQYKSCIQCKAHGKSCCNCSGVQSSNSTFVNKVIDPDLSKNDTRHSCNAVLVSAGSKLTFNEIDSLLNYNSSLSKSHSRHLQSIEKGRFKMCITPEIVSNNLACHQHDPKEHFTSQKNDSSHGQNVMFSKSHQSPLEDLPERISTYLSKHLLARKEMYNNNNSRFVDQLHFDGSRLDVPTNAHEISVFEPTGDGNFEKKFQQKCVDHSRNSLQDAVVVCASSDDLQDQRGVRDTDINRERVTQKQSQVWAGNVQDMYEDTTNNNDQEKHSHDTLSSVVEDKACVIVGYHPLYQPVIGSSQLQEKVIQAQSGQDRMRQNEHVSKKLFTERINSTEMSYFRPEECDIPSNTVRDYQLKLLFVKGNEDVRFSEATSVSTKSIPFSSLSTKGPSLYKRLSQIHFSEKTRRYEWTAQPISAVKNRESTKLLNIESRGNISSNQERLNIRLSQQNLATNIGFRDSSTSDVKENILNHHRDRSISDVTENRSDSQLSDSGNFSMSGVSSGHISYTDKLACNNNQIPFHIGHERSTNPEISRSKMATDHCAFAAKDLSQPRDLHNKDLSQPRDLHNKDLSQPRDLHNKDLSQLQNSNNNCYSQQSLNKNEHSCIHRSRELHIPRMSFHNLDPVVKRLDFSNTTLEESTAEINNFEMCKCNYQSCLDCDSHEENILDGNISRILPTDAHVLPLEAETGIDAMKSQANLRNDNFTNCDDSEQICVDTVTRHFIPEYDPQHETTHDTPSYINHKDFMKHDTLSYNNQEHNDSKIFSFLKATATQETNFDCSLLTNSEDCSYINTNLGYHSHATSTLPFNLSDDVENISEKFEQNVNRQRGRNETSEEGEVTDLNSTGELFNINSDLGKGLREAVSIYDNVSYIPCQLDESNHCRLDTCGQRGCASHNNHVPLLGGDSENVRDVQIFDPGAFLNVTLAKQEEQYCTQNLHGGQHCNISFQNNAMTSNEDDDAWSSILEDSTQIDESSMGTPVTRLYKLLVESQEMIHSLEKYSVKPNVVEVKISCQ